MIRLNVFEVTLFEDDALEFCSKPKKEKTEWIKSNTIQTSNVLIKDFVDSIENIEIANCKNCNCK